MKSSTMRQTVSVAIASALTGVLVAAGGGAATAAPQSDPQARVWEAAPRPIAPQVPGYRITGYNLGEGNYQGALDPQTGKLWMTQVAPMRNTESASLLRVDPHTMRVEKRIRVGIKSPRNGKVSPQYGIGVAPAGNTIWTTGSSDNMVSVWDKNTGALLKTFKGATHASHMSFVPQLGVVLIATAEPASIAVYDFNTITSLGAVVLPGEKRKSENLAVGIDVTDASSSGATVTVSTYMKGVVQLRLSRSGRQVNTKVLFNTPQVGDGHGAVLADKSRNRFYVTNLYAGTVSEYNLTTGARIRNIATGPGPSSLALDTRRDRLYVNSYFAGFISVVDQRTGAVVSRLTTGLLPNQLLSWGQTVIVIDKSSTILQGGAVLRNGIDHVWKITPTS